MLKRETPAINGPVVQITFQSFSDRDPSESVIGGGGTSVRVPRWEAVDVLEEVRTMPRCFFLLSAERNSRAGG
jgi:hypothetical protein